MPKSRSNSLGARTTIEPGEEEMSERIEDRLQGVEVDVELPSRTRGRMENLHVSFSGNTAAVASASGNTYEVNIPDESCTCMDFVHRGGRCRHIEAVSIAQGMVSRGITAGSVSDSQVAPSIATAETMRAQMESEFILQNHPHTDDNFFYTENREQFEADKQRLLNEPLPYYYDNVLNGSPITFGIELEFVNGNSDAIARELYDMGICGTPRMSSYHSDRVEGKWALEHDGSVTDRRTRRGGELISPILQDTPETWRTLQTICEVAKRHGATVNTKTGGHVHIGAEASLDGKKQRWRRFFKMTAGFEDVFHRLSGGEQGVFRGIYDNEYALSSRRQSHSGITSYMPPEGEIREFQRIVSGSLAEGKYRSVNLLPFASKKTVEFRAFNGTLTPEIIQANVKYAAGLVNAAERSRTRTSENFNVTESDKKRGKIINDYRSMEYQHSDEAMMNVLDTVCSRKEDKEHILAVLVRNRWA